MERTESSSFDVSSASQLLPCHGFVTICHVTCHGANLQNPQCSQYLSRCHDLYPPLPPSPRSRFKVRGSRVRCSMFLLLPDQSRVILIHPESSRVIRTEKRVESGKLRVESRRTGKRGKMIFSFPIWFSQRAGRENQIGKEKREAGGALFPGRRSLTHLPRAIIGPSRWDSPES